MQKARIGVLIVVVALLLSSWSASAQTTIRVAHWWGENAFVEVWELFEELNPDIKIVVQPAPWSGYVDKMLMEIAAGTGPDVYFLDSGNFTNVFGMGVLEPLAGYAERDGLDLSKFSADPFVEHGYGGDFYALAQWIPDNPNFRVNLDLAKAAGLHVPQLGDPDFDTWNWDDLLNAAQKTTVFDSDGRHVQWGLGPIANTAWNTIFAWQNGGEIFDDVYALNETRSTLASPENIETYQYLADLVHEHRVMMSPTQAGLLAQGAYLSGQTAFTLDWNLYGDMVKAEFEWSLMPIPWQTRKVTKYGGNSWTISSRSQNKDAAWRLVSWLTTDLQAQQIMARYGTISSYDPAMQVDFAEEEMQRYLFQMLVDRLGDDVTLRPLWWGSRNSTRVGQIISDAIDLIYLEQADVAQTLQAAEAEINRVIYRVR